MGFKRFMKKVFGYAEEAMDVSAALVELKATWPIVKQRVTALERNDVEVQRFVAAIVRLHEIAKDKR